MCGPMTYSTGPKAGNTRTIPYVFESNPIELFPYEL